MKALKIIGIICAVLLVGAMLYFTVTPSGVAACNTWKHGIHKADDDTNYQTRKHVEDTCRAMIASYNADKLTYEQYNGSEDPEKQSWADQAKMRANRTAATYNGYVLKNSYVWSGNIPADICRELEFIK